MGVGRGGWGEQAKERTFSQGLVLGFGLWVLAQADFIARLETENPLAVRSERRALRVQPRLPHHPPPPLPPHTHPNVCFTPRAECFSVSPGPTAGATAAGAPRSSAPPLRPSAPPRPRCCWRSFRVSCSIQTAALNCRRVLSPPTPTPTPPHLHVPPQGPPIHPDGLQKWGKPPSPALARALQ